SRRRHTRFDCDWSSDVCSSDLTSTVFHIAARALATHALSIFGDHSDVMSARSCGWAMLFANSVQETMDFALVSQAATLRSRLPRSEERRVGKECRCV